MEKISRIKDPEIPTISILDLGIIHDIKVLENKVIVEIKKTYTNCIALDLIKLSIENDLKDMNINDFEVVWVYSPPWRSSDITPRGKIALKEAGICPPDEETCPYCNSKNVVLKSEFGPTRCRMIYYCNNCKNPFEKFR
ncbi:MAG: phenylacetate-CoA oxygenase subunit PaaJ [candidate division WOR-3 bacterium]|nr:phenylacetate-CoA oxygenase subunit PaaJ [candidate division WOR-3 bacterium]